VGDGLLHFVVEELQQQPTEHRDVFRVGTHQPGGEILKAVGINLEGALIESIYLAQALRLGV
jgi:hypothetical protein